MGKKIISIICLLTFLALPDVLVFHGTVTNSANQAPISGTIVTVTSGFGASARYRSDTADAAGIYKITWTTDSNQVGDLALRLSAIASGYIPAQYMTTVRNPNNGISDTVTHDFVLTENNNPVQNDSVVIIGTVRSAIDSAPVANATILVSFVGANMPQTSTITTSTGGFNVILCNSTHARTVTLTITKSGYMNGTAYSTVDQATTIKDTITKMIYLNPIVYDTISISGKTIDSASLADLNGASVIISYVNSTTGTSNVNDTTQTGSDGIFSIKMPVQKNVSRIFWTIEKNGYTTRTGFISIPINKTIYLGVVSLTQYSITDTLTYTITGRILNRNGAGIGGASVIVSLAPALSGATATLKDTVVSSVFGLNPGNYTVIFRKPYAAGTIVVTVSATANNYNPASSNLTVASSTTDINLNVTMIERVAVRKGFASKVMGSEMRVTVLTLDGRMIGKGSDIETILGAVHPRCSGEPVVVRNSSNGIQTTKVMIVH
jgi:hypothetical protein